MSLSATATATTRVAVRNFLARRGFKKGGLSSFVEETVRWRVFDHMWVSGDKRGVLTLKDVGACRIVTVRELVREIGL